MLNRVDGYWKDGPPTRLEGWLVRKLEGGALKELPRYFPPGGRANHCPEQYARALLFRMRTTADDARAREQVKDDGRAFRSWAEAVRALVF